MVEMMLVQQQKLLLCPPWRAYPLHACRQAPANAVSAAGLPHLGLLSILPDTFSITTLFFITPDDELLSLEGDAPATAELYQSSPQGNSLHRVPSDIILITQRGREGT